MIARLRCALRSHARVKLRGRGKGRAFCQYDALQQTFGPIKFAGLTKCLERKLYAPSSLPIAKAGRKLSGFKRGTLVDRQLTKIANSRTRKVDAPRKLHRITTVILSALATDGIQLVCAQVPVCHQPSRIASAVDLVGIRACDDDESVYELVLIEIKTGYDQDRQKNVGNRRMEPPFEHIQDTWCHRHLAQLACTWYMFVKNVPLIQELQHQCAIRDISAMLLYATERDVEAVPLPEYWGYLAYNLLDNISASKTY